MFDYAWYHWIAFFYIYCFIGWLFESVYASLKEKALINRGFLRLPLLPLYGTGAVIVLWLSLPFNDSLFLVYCSGVVAATVLEYVTGAVMECLFKVRYWDYSDIRWNLHGYICLSSSLAWGVLTILLTRVLHPLTARLVLSLPAAVEFAMLGIVSFLFAADCIHSVKAALNLAQALETITKVRAELDELQLQLALLKAETSQYLEKQKQLGQLKAAAFKAASYKTAGLKKTARFTSSLRQKLTAQLADLTEKRHAILSHSSRHLKGLLRSNPTAASKRFAEALKELREAMNNNK